MYGLYFIVALAALAASGMWIGFYLLLGLFLGSLLRDLGWVRASQRSWPFTMRVVNWDLVEQLAVKSHRPDPPRARPQTPFLPRSERFSRTPEFGYKAVEKPVHVHDLHATILDLLGFDHTSLTYRYAGRDFRSGFRRSVIRITKCVNGSWQSTRAVHTNGGTCFARGNIPDIESGRSHCASRPNYLLYQLVGFWCEDRSMASYAVRLVSVGGFGFVRVVTLIGC